MREAGQALPQDAVAVRRVTLPCVSHAGFAVHLERGHVLDRRRREATQHAVRDLRSASTELLNPRVMPRNSLR